VNWVQPFVISFIKPRKSALVLLKRESNYEMQGKISCNHENMRRVRKKNKWEREHLANSLQQSFQDTQHRVFIQEGSAWSWSVQEKNELSRSEKDEVEIKSRIWNYLTVKKSKLSSTKKPGKRSNKWKRSYFCLHAFHSFKMFIHRLHNLECKSPSSTLLTQNGESFHDCDS
jgi:phosphomevalonate kinase